MRGSRVDDEGNALLLAGASFSHVGGGGSLKKKTHSRGEGFSASTRGTGKSLNQHCDVGGGPRNCRTNSTQELVLVDGAANKPAFQKHTPPVRCELRGNRKPAGKTNRAPGGKAKNKSITPSSNGGGGLSEKEGRDSARRKESNSGWGKG